MSKALGFGGSVALGLGIAFASALAACGDGGVSSSRALPLPDNSAATAATSSSSGGPGGDPSGESQAFTATPPPPAISGGTLIMLADGVTAIAADPDRDLVTIVDTSLLSVRGSIALESGDEPGRSAADGLGRVWVALRRGGAIAVLDVVADKVVLRLPVCSEPRGIAYDSATKRMHVACSGGELVTFSALDGSVVRRLELDRDLRDVIVDQGGVLHVSRFRSAELLTLDANGAVTSRVTPPTYVDTEDQTFEPAVAWRTLASPTGGMVMLHQRGLVAPVQQQPMGYGQPESNPCSVIVHTAVTIDDPSNPSTPGAGGIPGIAVAVDMAIDPGGDVAIASAGNNLVIETGLSWLASTDGLVNCGLATSPLTTNSFPLPSPPTAVVFDGAGDVVVQMREPPMISVFGQQNNGDIMLPGATRRDSGHDLFHAMTPGGLACASCHPEGREDGRVWDFDEEGLRRTKTVSGGVLETAPLHWDGDLPNLDALVAEVLVSRMSGDQPGPMHEAALAHWLNTIPAPIASPPADAVAVKNGSTLFHDPMIGCSGCHSGPNLTTAAMADVGTGKAFKIPSLTGISARAPYMHTGCAATLTDRFVVDECAGISHGSIANLTSDQIASLVAYLETL